MKQRVEELQAKMKEELRSVLFEVWETVETTLIESMSRRIALVIEKAVERILYCIHQSK
jgi:hypothetical protein